jgi:paraquat-inducible protein B
MQKYNAPRVKESKKIQILTTIWLVPFLAMIIALWLAFQYYAKIGPVINISFKSNAGLIANQSQIKLRDVTVGMVTKISLSDDGKGVVVQAQMNKEVSKYLNNKAKLWIVHPDVGSHGVSGLDTLLSGSYIELHGVKDESTQRHFIGLENPYLDTDAEGKYYLLSAPQSYNITEGSNIYYRMIKVGRVERVGIAPNGEKINFTIFVKKRYTNYINKKSKFYAQSSFSIDFSQAKIDMHLASFSQLIHGGISIYTPIQTLTKRDKEYKITKGEVFPLYKNLSQLKSKQLIHGEENQIYTFIFATKKHKLEIGSPVELQGFQVGYITDIESQFNEKNKAIESKIYALLYTSSFKRDSESNASSTIKRLIENGLKGKLASTLPMIGAEYIDLIFDTTVKAKLIKNDNYPIFPTIRKKLSSNNIISNTQNLLIKLEKLPLENLLISATKLVEESRKPVKKIFTNINTIILRSKKPIEKILKDLENTIKNINTLSKNEALQEIPQNINMTLQELERTLQELQTFTQGYDVNSQFSAELSATLHELSLAAESIGRVSRKLEKKPNSLLLGDD